MELRNDRKTERQKDGMTERQRDEKTEMQKDRKMKRQKDRKTEMTDRQKDIEKKDSQKFQSEIEIFYFVIRYLSVCYFYFCFNFYV